MTEYPIPSRLREIASDLRAKARASKSASPVAVQAFRDMETFASRLNEIITELEQPVAGTSAYEMVAAAEMAHVNTTHTLLGMVAATVLAKLIDEGDCSRANISFTPRTMDDMYARYDLAIEQEGLETKVRITPKPGAFAQGGKIELTGVTDPKLEMVTLPPAEAALAGRPESLMRQDEPDSPADEQAIPTEAEKHYFFNDGTKRYGPMPLATAEQHARMTPNLLAHIENRACPLVDCPSAGHATSCAWETCPNRK